MSMYLTIFGKPRYLGLVNIDGETVHPEKGEIIVAETMRGLELVVAGGTISGEQEDRYRNTCCEDLSDGQPKGGEPMLQNISFIRIATPEDMLAAQTQRNEEESVLVKARELLTQHDLPMKLVDVEYLLDRKKLFFYFTSDQRVDFRAYVRDLAREFKTRIELRQIGVRDEAKTVRGLGPCGRECCCGYWLHKFDPICIKMVKEQNLALNPTKISGVCGRLMCCMAYEHKMYETLWKDLPNPGSKIKAPHGSFVIVGVDLAHEAFRARTPEGAEILVPVREFENFKETVLRGDTWDASICETPPLLLDEEEVDEVDEGGTEEYILEDETCVLASVVTDSESYEQSSDISENNEDKKEHIKKERNEASSRNKKRKKRKKRPPQQQSTENKPRVGDDRARPRRHYPRKKQRDDVHKTKEE